jgi:hypothetical protein
VEVVHRHEPSVLQERACIGTDVSSAHRAVTVGCAPPRDQRGRHMTTHQTTPPVDPVAVVSAMIDASIEVMPTWVHWDGRPVSVEDRIYTPHKAVRRLTDHLIDHIAQVEAMLAGAPAVADEWHASAITTASDLAPFSREDADEAIARLNRLKTMWQCRIAGLSDEQLDARSDDEWSIREIAAHLAESEYYAAAVGRLEP